MRKEDLKKLCREEKIASAVNRILFKSALISLLYFSSLSAQIPVNGFCRYREFTTKPDYTNILSVDYNSDGYRDILLYNPDKKSYATLTSDAKSNFKITSERYSAAPLTELHPFGSEASAKRFLIASRKTRQVMLSSFSKNGNISSVASIKFNGYPASIDVADTDGDGKPEGLVSGKALDGLYILKGKRNSLEKIKIEKNKNFLWSGFVDLDYDSFPDIAAVDQLSNSVIFYDNDLSGGFTMSRSIALTGEVTSCRTADFNSDGFTDLVLVQNNHFEILLGDSVSSFKSKTVLETPVVPDKYEILDFNGDGFNDIAYINLQAGELYISFSKSGDKFYPPILYLKKNNLVSLSASIDRAGKKIAALTADGQIFLINTIGIKDASFSVTGGVNPAAVNSFDYMNDRYKEICYVDSGMQSLIILLSERRNLFRTYFSIPLLNSYSKILIDDTDSKTKTFYLFTNGEKAIEIVRMNFETHGYTKLVLYADYPIEDLKLSVDRLKDWQTISVLGRENGDLFLQSYELKNFRKTGSALYPVGSGVERAWLAFSIYQEIYIFSRKDNKAELTKTVFNKKVTERKLLLSFDVGPKDGFSYDLIAINEIVHRNKPVVVLITEKNRSYLYNFSGDDYRKYSLRHTAAQDPRLGSIFDRNSEQYTLFYKDRGMKKLWSAAFSGSDNKMIEQELIESKDINNYLVTELYKGKAFLIYSGSSQNTLSFEKLK